MHEIKRPEEAFAMEAPGEIESRGDAIYCEGADKRKTLIVRVSWRQIDDVAFCACSKDLNARSRD